MGKRTELATIILAYDAAQDFVDTAFPAPATRLETPEQITRHFDSIRDWWKRECGRKVPWLVDYTGFSVNLNENVLYGKRVAELFEYGASAIIRYGGDALQRTAVRLYSMRIHNASNLYENREQALEVLRAIREGRVKVASG